MAEVPLIPESRLLGKSIREVAFRSPHGLTVVGRLFHAFRDAQGQPAGVTGTVVLAESHLAIHTWPEIGAVTLDVYVCNFSGDNSNRAHALFDEVIGRFAPDFVEKKEVARGHLGSPLAD